MSYREYYFDIRKTSDRLLRLLRISVIEYEASGEYSAALHAHDFYELLFVTEGSGKLYLSGRFHAVSKGCFVLIAPGQEHYEVALPNRRVAFRSIAFLGPEDWAAGNALYQASDDYAPLESMVYELFQEYESSSEYRSAYCQNLAENLIIRLLRKTSGPDKKVPPPRRSPSACSSPSGKFRSTSTPILPRTLPWLPSPGRRV